MKKYVVERYPFIGDRPNITDIEEYISNIIEDQKKEHDARLPLTEKISKKEFSDKLKQIQYWQYIDSADIHYFVSRILFLNCIYKYSFFCAHQCVENYLKAYLKYCDISPPITHVLNELLEKCRENSGNKQSFITGEFIEFITQKFEPFYELARYPIQHTRPKNGHQFSYPNEIYILDYFVFRMKEILPIPEDKRDIFRAEPKGHFDLISCQKFQPDLFDLFLTNNINFK